jgi:HD domain
LSAGSFRVRESPVDISRVTRMALVHDLVEIDAGDNQSPGNADLSDEAAGVSNDGAKSQNADIAASAGNAKRRAPNVERFPIFTDQRDAI